MLGGPGELQPVQGGLPPPPLLGCFKETIRESGQKYDPRVGGQSTHWKEKVKWDAPAQNGALNSYRQQKESRRSSGVKGSTSETRKSEAFVSRAADGARLSQTRSQRVAEARTADGHWAVRMSTVTTKSFHLSSQGPPPVMDLDTVEGVSTLDHTHQKGRSELAHKGSLGHRRPPTRAGLRALVSSVWSEDATSDISEEPRDAVLPTETEGQRWKQPPKHAVLVFPMQLLNNSKLRNRSPTPEPPASPIIHFEDDENKNSDDFQVHGQSNKTTTVKIRPASEQDSDNPEEDMNSRNLSKRHSGPTIVSITLKEPVSRTSSLDLTNNAKNTLLHGVDSDLESLSGSSMVITIGDLTGPACQDTGTQMYGTLRGSRKKKKERAPSPVAKHADRGTQILIRPFNRTPEPMQEEELSSNADKHSSRSSERCSSLVYIRGSPPPASKPLSFDGGGWNARTSDEDSKENYQTSFRRVSERGSSVSSMASRESSKEASPDRSLDSGVQRSSRRDGHNRVQIQTWDRRTQPAPASPSPSRIRELVLQPPRSGSVSSSLGVPAQRPASIIGDGGETERSQRQKDHGRSSCMSSPTGDRYRPWHIPHRAVLGERENKPEWLTKINLDKRKGIDWDNLGRFRRSSGSRSPDSNRLDRSFECLSEGRHSSRWSSLVGERISDRSTESLPCLSLLHEGRASRTPYLLLEETAEEEENTSAPAPSPPTPREPEWVKIAQRRREKSHINWESIAALRTEPDGSARRSSVDEVPDLSQNVGVQVNLRRHQSSRQGSSGSRERRTASEERTPNSYWSESRRPERAKMEVTESKPTVTKVKVSPDRSAGDKTCRSGSESHQQHASRRGRSTSPPSRRYSQDKEVIIKEIPKVEEVRSRHRAREPQSWDHTRDTEASRSRRKSRSPHSRPAPETSRRSSGSDRRCWQTTAFPEAPAPTVRSPVPPMVQSETESDDGEDPSAGSKKKVRFMISSDDGQQKKVLSITPTTYTMFGMEREAGNKHKDKRNKGSSSPDQTGSERRTSRPDSGSGSEDYELQAYKIINQIKQMTKDKSTAESRQRGSSRETSPIRPPTGRREASPDCSAQDWNRRRSSGGMSRNEKVHQGSNRRRSQQGSHNQRSSREHSPASSTDSTPQDPSPVEPQNGRIRGKGPDWLKKALHKQKSSVDWDNLEKCSSSGPDKPLWAGVKLKRTPFSSKFLSAENLALEDGYRPEALIRQRTKCAEKTPETFTDGDEQQLSQDQPDIGHQARIVPVTNGEWNEPEIQKNKEGESESCSADSDGNGSTELVTVNDSEGYSSMESSRSLKTRPQAPSPCCSHCGRNRENEDWSSPTSSPLNSVVNGEEDEEPQQISVVPLVVDAVSKKQEETPALGTVTVRVVDSSVEDKGTRPTDGCHSDEDNVSKEEPRIPNGNYVNLEGCDEKRQEEKESIGKTPVPPARVRRRQSLLDKRQKLIDLLTSKSLKRGPQVKTIKKTIRRILRGSEYTDEEEEEIVEEITEEVFGFADGFGKAPIWKNVKHLCSLKGVGGGQRMEPKNGSVTRTVLKTEDGRHFLTTSYVPDDKSGGGRKIFNTSLG